MYVFKNTEINNEKASDSEAKSMLFLVGMHQESEEIDVVTFDCFNDVTGSTECFSKMWDIQSKNYKDFPPSKIGESLYTLYDNFMSSFDFHEYILFCNPLKTEYLLDDSQPLYRFDNIVEATKIRIVNKLTTLVKKNHNISDVPYLEAFLDQVTFYEDRHSKSDYIKSISKFQSSQIVDESVYNNIFKEIRDKQSALKNSYIENKIINKPEEVLNFNRHLTKNQIHTLIISKLVGIEIFSFEGIPIPFINYLVGMSEDDIEDMLLDCKSNISKAFFDKNSYILFWSIIENITFEIHKKKTSNVDEVFNKTKSRINKIPQYLDEISLKYLISLLISGSKK
ncbi:hypothetical protein VSVS12_03732 [Vibrio scophthalmi]|uniref:hypothetical protein n=1 Tax=Vibrio scophthalmi TaxID=45658 RepID=UPI00080939A0|nr:hypothetical protein [Vibrio scophthalmi]ANS87432.1 hypothetical protein VSVS12_03732 [Vibrio scophthalmi]